MASMNSGVISFEPEDKAGLLYIILNLKIHGEEEGEVCEDTPTVVEQLKDLPIEDQQKLIKALELMEKFMTKGVADLVEEEIDRYKNTIEWSIEDLREAVYSHCDTCNKKYTTDCTPFNCALFYHSPNCGIVFSDISSVGS